MTTLHRTTCAHCTAPLNRRQQKDGQRFCSRACLRAESLIGKAESVGIPRGTLYQANREGRVIDWHGEIKIRARRRCAGCGQMRGIKGSAKLCTVCTQDSAWCSQGQHAVPKYAMAPGDTRCRECAEERGKANNKIQVPPGYVPLKVAAARMGYTAQTLHDALQRGWMDGQWVMIGNRIFIVDQPTYAPWEWAL